jgi:hypothetical protein
MLANTVGEGMPRQPNRCLPSVSQDHDATHQPKPNLGAALTARA